MPKVELSLEHAKTILSLVNEVSLYSDQEVSAYESLENAIDYADAKQDVEKDAQ